MRQGSTDTELQSPHTSHAPLCIATCPEKQHIAVSRCTWRLFPPSAAASAVPLWRFQISTPNGPRNFPAALFFGIFTESLLFRQKCKAALHFNSLSTAQEYIILPVADAYGGLSSQCRRIRCSPLEIQISTPKGRGIFRRPFFWPRLSLCHHSSVTCRIGFLRYIYR